MSITDLNVTQRTFGDYVCCQVTLEAIQAPNAPISKELSLFGFRRLVLTRANLVEAQFAQEYFLVHGSGAIVERVREADVVTELR